MGEPLRDSTPEAARARMIALAPRLAREAATLAQAHGRILAEDVTAHRDQPPFAASAMDGYAVRAADTPGHLAVVGEASAGAGMNRALQANEAARIFTGAPLPAGADAVIIQEDATREGLRLTAPLAAPGAHVRPRGIDYAAGEVLLRAGTRLDAVALTLAASTGAGALPVAQAPRVCIAPTGDELAAPGTEAGAHQIYDSLSAGLLALARAWGASAERLAPCADRMEALSAAFADALSRCDLLVTIGGASVGDRDLVKPALAGLGLELAVERVAMRPGKPVWFGRVGACAVLGLPGNPASALVCAQIFLRPLLLAMQGAATPAPAPLRARLHSALPANGPREHYLRGRLSCDADGRLGATPFEAQDSSLLSVFRDADCLIRLPALAPAQAAGALVDIFPLARGEGVLAALPS